MEVFWLLYILSAGLLVTITCAVMAEIEVKMLPERNKTFGIVDLQSHILFCDTHLKYVREI